MKDSKPHTSVCYRLSKKKTSVCYRQTDRNYNKLESRMQIDVLKQGSKLITNQESERLEQRII